MARDLVVRYEGDTAGADAAASKTRAQLSQTAAAAEQMSKRFEVAANRAGASGGRVGAGLLKGVAKAAASQVVTRAGQQIGNKLYEETSKRFGQSGLFQKLQPTAAKAGMQAGVKVATGIERQVSKTNWDRLKSPKVAVAAVAVGLIFGRRFMQSAESQIKPAGLSTKLAGGLKAGALGLAAGAAGAGFAVARGLQSVVKASSDAQQSIGAVDAIFGRYSKNVQRDARNAAQSVGLSANSYRELASTLGSTLKNKGIDDFAGKTKGLIGLGADLSAVYGGTAKDAVESLTSALRGETDPIEKYGVTINQAAIQQEALRLGLTKSKGAVTGQVQAMAALSLINKQTASSQGQFIAQSGTYAEKLQIASAGFDNLKVQLGDKFLPVATQTMGFVANKAIPAISKWVGTTKGLGPVVDQLGPLLKGLGQTAATVFGPASGTGLRVYTSGIRNLIDYVVTHQADLINGLVNGGKAALALGQGLADGAVGGLHALGGLSAGLGDFVQQGTSTLGVFVHQAATAFDWVPGIGAKLATADKAFGDFQKTADRSADGLRRGGKTISDYGTLLGETLNPALQKTRDRLVAVGQQEGIKAKQRDATAKFAVALRDLGRDAKGSEVHLKSWADRTNLGVQSQRRLERQVNGARSALQGQIGAQQAAGAGQDALSKTWQRGRDRLAGEFRQMGLSKKAAGQLADKYAGIKPKVKTTFSTPGLADANRQAGSLNSTLRKIPTNIQVKITQEVNRKGDRLLSKSDANVPMATGGVWMSGPRGGKAIRAAAGRVLPGWSPGRDIHRFYSATGGRLDLSGGEAVMVPQFTRAVGGPRGVADLNRRARTGDLGQEMASGGVPFLIPAGPAPTAPRASRTSSTDKSLLEELRYLRAAVQDLQVNVDVTADHTGIRGLVRAEIREALRTTRA